MGLLGKALGREKRATLGQPGTDLEAWTFGSTYGGRSVTVESSLRLVPVFSAVRLKSEAVGSLPLIVYKRLQGSGRERATDHWMWRLLHDQPNPSMSADEVWQIVAAHYETWGNAFLLKIKRPGSIYPVDELWPARPERVQVDVWTERDRQNGVLPAGASVGDRFFVLDGKTNEPLTEDDVIHIRNMSLDGIVGLSPIQQARNMLGTVEDMEEFSGNFWGSGAVNAVVASHPQKLSPAAQENVRRSIKQKLGAKGGAEPFVLEEGMTLDSLTMPLGDAQFIEQARMSLLQVALLFRIPPKMLGAATGDSLTYTSSEWESLDFIRWSLRPVLTRIEGSLRRDANLFLQGRRFYPEFLIDALLRGTSQERAEFYEKALNADTGWMSREEVRDLENLPAEADLAAPDALPALDEGGEPVDGEPVLDAPVPQLQIPMTVNGRGRAG